MLDRLDVYFESGQPSAALNMALDEALLENAARPALRFYNWARPSLSFGYFGKLADAQAVGGDREIVRRWTGGGIVLHGEDLTYSLVAPAAHPYARHSAREIYQHTHSAIRDVLVAAGWSVSMVTTPASRVSEACFANPVVADLMAGDAKIAGAAQRRTRLGLLQQGSILFRDLPEHFAAQFASRLSSAVDARSITDTHLRRAQTLAAEKYGTRAWLEERQTSSI